MVAGRLLQHRRHLSVLEGVVGGREEVSEQLARAERAGADLDEPQARRVGQRAAAAQAENLAAGGRALGAAAGRSSRARADASPSTPASETKWPATVLSRKRTIGVGPGRPTEASFERAVASSVGYAWSEPTGTPNQTARTERERGRYPLDGLRDAPVLRDLGAGEHADQHGRPDRDPDGGEQRSRRAPADPAPGQSDDVQRRPHAVARRRR